MIVYASNPVLDFEQQRLIKQHHQGQSLLNSHFPKHFTLHQSLLFSLHCIIVFASRVSPHTAFLSLFRGENENVSLQNSFALLLFLCRDSSQHSCQQRLLGALEMCISRRRSVLGCQGKLKRGEASWVVTGFGKERGALPFLPLPICPVPSCLSPFINSPFTSLGLVN